MLNHQPDQLIFRAIADPTRRAIIDMLAQKDRSIGEIAAGFEMTRPAVAKHLAILKDGRLIDVEKRGRERIHRLRPDTLKSAASWINQFDKFWDDRLAKLKKAVEETQ